MIVHPRRTIPLPLLTVALLASTAGPGTAVSDGMLSWDGTVGAFVRAREALVNAPATATTNGGWHGCR
jgi:hypothetical protein